MKQDKITLVLLLAVIAVLTVCLLGMVTGCVKVPDAKALSPEISPNIAPEITTKMHDLIRVVVRLEVAKRMAAQSGPQTSGEGGVNVGAVNISGGTGALIGLAMVAAAAAVFVWLWKRGRVAGKTVDVLVDRIENTGVVGLKHSIMKQAIEQDVAKYLHRRVKKVTDGKKPKATA